MGASKTIRMLAPMVKRQLDRAAQRSVRTLPEWRTLFDDHLSNGILSFWAQHAVDREHGGLFTRLDRSGRSNGTGNKAVVEHARTIGTFAVAHRTTRGRSMPTWQVTRSASFVSTCATLETAATTGWLTATGVWSTLASTSTRNAS